MAAVQLARTRSAEVFGTASGWKHQGLREAGVAHPMGYDECEGEGHRLTGGQGVGVVLDALGGSAAGRDLRMMGDLGRLVVYGISSAVRGGRRSILSLLWTVLTMPRPRLLSLMNRNQGVFGLNVGHLWDQVPVLRRAMAEIISLFERGDVRPRIAEVFPFDRAAAARRFLQERRNFGKILLRV